jgi:hypothetical protein
MIKAPPGSREMPPIKRDRRARKGPLDRHPMVAADAELYREPYRFFVQGQHPIPWHLTHSTYSALDNAAIISSLDAIDKGKTTIFDR